MRENRNFCKLKGIRISGRPLADAQYKADLKDRIIVEEKFGEAKKTYSLNRVMPDLKETTLSVLHAVATAKNLKRWLWIASYSAAPNHFVE